MARSASRRARLKTLLITPDFPPDAGGIQVLLYRMVSHFERTETCVIAPDQPGAREFDGAGRFQVRRVRAAGRTRAGTIAALNAQGFRHGLAYRPDVVVAGHVVVSPAARAVARALGVPLVQYTYAMEIRARPRLARSALGSADAIVAISRHTESLDVEAGAAPARIHLVPPGVDQAERRGERSSTPTLVTVSRLDYRYKGHDVLARAFPLIRARVPGAEWVVVGDGALRPYLQALVSTQQASDGVRWLGRVSDEQRDQWLDRARVFAMPSRVPAGGEGGEGFGIAYLEAGTHELPVVAGNVGGALDAVVDGETGLLVDPQDHLAVADAVAELMSEPDRASDMGRAGAARAREFSWPRVARKLEDLLLEVERR